MKRAGWIVCLLLGGGFGWAASAMSRPTAADDSSESEGALSAVCPTGSGEACSCSTGTNRAALLLQEKGQPAQAELQEKAGAEWTGD